MVILLKSSDLSLEAIKSKTRGFIGKNVLFFEKVDSTNTIAVDIAEKSDEGTVVLADSQERGRGRLGRAWISPPGTNIYMSVIIKPTLGNENITLITIMAAVSCAIALRRLTGLDISIKWPNDIVLNNKKLGGILTELKIYDKKIIFAIIGIGINVNVGIDVFPEDVRKIATSLRRETGRVYSRNEIVAEILNEIDYWHKFLNEKDKNILLSEWQRFASTLGREVMVVTGKESYRGLAESIDNQGMLMLRLPSGELKRISTGDLKVLK
ncbi:MAG: biotin--[acetyl-CoA-carboxylase] ligase [Nitrospirae bacterium]|jgi:BirA family transcriptional regulator, biotin operon repressor / biotin---[acetyl-CoA-carboxylase] ligase|nr:biotin--[acetyl-CoA-carboxylase] ligase [Nitrospirota bacterium]